MELGLKDRAVLVTGGSRGIGRAIAVRFGQQGARVALTYHRRREAAEKVAAEVAQAGGEAHTVAMDLADLDSVEAAVTAVIERWSGLDALVNNAVDWMLPDGASAADSFAERPERIEDAPVEHWRATLRSNLDGPFRATQVAAPALRRSTAGRVVFISSDLAENGMTGAWAYSAAKAGLHGLTASLAVDLGRDGVLVNVVAPGLTLDDGHHQIVPDEQLPQIASRRTAQRLATTDDVADAVVFACSAANGAISGEVLRVTGGRQLYGLGLSG